MRSTSFVGRLGAAVALWAVTVAAQADAGSAACASMRGRISGEAARLEMACQTRKSPQEARINAQRAQLKTMGGKTVAQILSTVRGWGFSMDTATANKIGPARLIGAVDRTLNDQMVKTVANVQICKLKVAAWAAHARSATATSLDCLPGAFVFPEPAYEWNPAAFLI